MHFCLSRNGLTLLSRIRHSQEYQSVLVARPGIAPGIYWTELSVCDALALV